MMDDTEALLDVQPFVPVCAIGASAGGVAALQNLFRHIPDDLGLAYVVILHLNPDEPSVLSEILSACTAMPVHQVNDGPPLRPNSVYVIPPDRELVIDGDNVTARPFSEPRSQRALIDKFFRSVAAGRGDGVAIILSGAGSDGALGIAAMKEAGGIILVQDPEEAGFPSMPQNAIATGMVDFVAPIARLSERLVEVARSKEAVRSLDMDGAANDLRRIIAVLRAKTGHDFSSYKRATVMRRVQRRMQVSRKLTLSDYADHLLTTPEAAGELFSDLLISVTMFFRDGAAFEVLAQEAIRPMVETAMLEEQESLRIWVVGCATGEEAYSVAILVHEELARQAVTLPFQVFATDLDETALAAARDGRYPHAIEADVSRERLARFFVDEGTHYLVRKELRESVLFAKHSILKEPPFMRLDLITCRNLLIYLERTVQGQVCSIFHYALRPGKYLFLGSAETTDAAAELFVPLDRQARLYCSRLCLTQSLPILPQFSTPEQSAAPGRAAVGGRERVAIPATLHIEALEDTAPPSILVDDGQTILHLSPSAGRYILNSAGPPSKVLADVVRPELRLDLRLALTRALHQGKPTATLPTVVAFDQQRRRVVMQVVPVKDAAQIASRALVYFLDGGEVGPSEELETLSGATTEDISRLYAELKASQEALLVSRSGHDASIQELRAANEEFQSINEEYRSTAEELETSKEELQSINEELHTVNAELKSKLESISAAHSDLQNLTSSSEIGTLFLDPSMQIRMFTPPVAKLFNITRRDLGRSISHFTHHLDHDDLEDDARQVLQDLTPIEREVSTRQGRHFSMRIRPYRTVDDRIDGTVVTFIDVSERTAAEAAMRKGEERLRDVLDSVTEGFSHFSSDFTILDVNAETLRLDGRKRDELVGRSHWEAFPGTEQSPLGTFYKEVMLNRQPGSFEHSYSWPDGRTLWLEVRAYPTSDGGMAIFWTDISDRKRRELNAVFLDSVTKALAALSAPDEILETAAEQIGEYLCLSGCAFADVTEAENEVSVQYGWAANGTPSLVRQKFRLDEYVTDELRRTAYADEVFAVDDTQTDMRTNAKNYAALRIGAIVAVQFQWGGQWTNYMIATDTGVRVWHDDEIALMRELTSRIFLRYERARAEAALRESESRYRSALRVGRIGSWETNYVSGVRRWSPEGMTLFGIDLPDGLGRVGGPDDEWRLSLHPDERGFPETLTQEIANLDQREVEYRIVRPNGEVVWLHGYLRVLDRDARGGVIRSLNVAADVTARRQAEAALRDSEERFRTMAEAIEDVFYMIDLDSNTLVYLSPRYEEIWGWPAETIQDNLGTFIDTIHPDDRQIAQDAKAAQARGEVVMVEYRVLRQDGGIRWILDRSFPVSGSVGRRLAGVAFDITERRRAEENRRSSDHRFRLLVESVRDYAIFTMDRNGIVTSWPAGAEAVFGWSEAEMLGRSVEATFVPEDVAAGVPALEMATALREGVAPNVRWHQRSDGSRVFINGSMQPLVGADGEVLELIKIGQDETQTRRVQKALTDSENRLRTLTEGIPQLVWRSVDDGQWTWSSPQWHTFTGQSFQDSLNRGWLHVVHPKDRDAALGAWVAALANGKVDVEYRVRRAEDGAWLWHHSRSVPVRDDQGSIIEWLGTTTDVQELKELQERQAVLVAELQHRTRNLITVVGSIARQTMAQVGPADDFRIEFEQRLKALARVQGLLSRSDEEPVTLDALIKMELAALGVAENSGRITMGGPAVPLRNSVVQTLALALHELATNALKHGALTQPEGRLSVTWNVANSDDKMPRLTLDWIESGTKSVLNGFPKRRGYGRELIERALPYALDAKTSYELGPTGLHCTIDLPLDTLARRKDQ